MSLTAYDARFGTRFWAKVLRGEGDACWLWTARHIRGYGQIKIAGRWRVASRVSWEIAHQAEIPAGMCVLHRCDDPRCVRPDHLFLGTHAENMADMVAKNRSDCRVGERNPRARLTVPDVVAIRRAAAAGIGAADLALTYGVARSTIESAVNGQNWSHVKEQA